MRASFELCKKNALVIRIYLRTDAQMYDLVFSILSGLLRPKLMQRHHNTWEEAQLLVDWIISDTVLGTVFNEIGRVQTAFYLLRGEILYKGKKIGNLSFGEHRILTALIENKDGVVAYETIASLILQKEDSFSLYSISKRIERLRTKLDEMGIGKHHIQTVRGVGFRMR